MVVPSVNVTGEEPSRQYVPRTAFARLSVTVRVSPLKTPLSTDAVAVGVGLPSYTTAIPVEPIEPDSVPFDTVKVLPVTISV